MPTSLHLSLLAYGTAALLPAALGAIGPEATINIVNRIVAPDGFERSAVLAEGIHPGPLIVGNRGNQFRLNVVDQLVDRTMPRSTSIHWHGLLQSGTPFMDGPAFVTQCPIAANHSFLYDFPVQQAGTFWYHSHLAAQYCDGLRGPFVIYDPNDPHKSLYDIDDESTVITLTDWYHVVSPAAGAVPTPSATLINGKGRYQGGPAVALSVINVIKGKRYRFRLVSISCDPNFTFSIDFHKFTIIEVDGVNHQPLEVDSIQIFAGQRYSFVMSANQQVGNYWIRANPNIGSTGFLGGLNSAILRYAGAAEAEPLSILPIPISLNPLIEARLAPLENPGAPGAPRAGGADVSLTLQMGFDGTHFSINNATYNPPTVPVLLQILSGAHSPEELLPSDSIISLPPNKVIELTIPPGLFPGLAGGPHPFHLHGHTFDVVKTAGALLPNYQNPVRRDVVSTGLAGDQVTIRFVTDNPGPWFLHCHIDWHLELGLAVIMAEDTQRISALTPIPESWANLCPIYDSLSPDQL